MGFLGGTHGLSFDEIFYRAVGTFFPARMRWHRHHALGCECAFIDDGQSRDSQSTAVFAVRWHHQLARHVELECT